MLIVLDNARNVEQVRPLLPGSPSCVAVVTSRDALAGLVARDGARRLDLDLLPLAEAVGLLRALIGERVDAEPEAAVTLAGQCARLPLALRVAAELAAASPGVSLADLTAELADQQQRLDLLDAGGDQRTAVRAVFSWSYRHLDAEAARAFRLLGLHPGADLDAYAAAALTGTTLRQARRLLDRLARAHLIQPAGTGPVRHARPAARLRRRTGRRPGQRAGAAGGADPPVRPLPAHRRRRGRYLVPRRPTASAASARRPVVPPVTSPPQRGRGSTRSGPPWSRSPRMPPTTAGPATPSAWPPPSSATSMSATSPMPPLIHSHARRAAARAGDRAAEAAALTRLGAADVAQGRLRQATGHLQQALALCREDGDRIGEARALGNLGMVDYCQGRYQRSAGCHRKALAIYLERRRPRRRGP